MLTQQNQLQAEIDFWREMISCQDQSGNGRALERMQQALALAERKLQLLVPSVLEWDAGTGDLAINSLSNRREH